MFESLTWKWRYLYKKAGGYPRLSFPPSYTSMWTPHAECIQAHICMWCCFQRSGLGRWLWSQTEAHQGPHSETTQNLRRSFKQKKKYFYSVLSKMLLKEALKPTRGNNIIIIFLKSTAIFPLKKSGTLKYSVYKLCWCHRLSSGCNKKTKKRYMRHSIIRSDTGTCIHLIQFKVVFLWLSDLSFHGNIQNIQLVHSFPAWDLNRFINILTRP